MRMMHRIKMGCDHVVAGMIMLWWFGCVFVLEFWRWLVVVGVGIVLMMVGKYKVDSRILIDIIAEISHSGIGK